MSLVTALIYLMRMVEELEKAQLGVKLKEYNGWCRIADNVALVMDSEARWKIKFNSEKNKV